MSVHKKIRVSREKHVVVISIHGSFCVKTALNFQDQLRDILSRSASEVLLDLRHTNYIVSDGIKAIVNIAEYLHDKRSIVIVCDEKKIIDLLEITGLTQFIQVHNHIDAGMQQALENESLHRLKNDETALQEGENVIDFFSNNMEKSTLHETTFSKEKSPDKKSLSIMNL